MTILLSWQIHFTLATRHIFIIRGVNWSEMNRYIVRQAAKKAMSTPGRQADLDTKKTAPDYSVILALASMT